MDEGERLHHLLKWMAQNKGIKANWTLQELARAFNYHIPQNEIQSLLEILITDGTVKKSQESEEFSIIFTERSRQVYDVTYYLKREQMPGFLPSPKPIPSPPVTPPEPIVPYVSPLPSSSSPTTQAVMTKGQKIHRILEYYIETNPDQYSWHVSELMSAFNPQLNPLEVQGLCRQIITHGDAISCESKDGFAIGFIDKSKEAFHMSKYLEIGVSPIVVALGSSLTIHGSVTGDVTQSHTSGDKSPISIESKSKPKSKTNNSKTIKWVITTLIALAGLIISLKACQ